MQLNGLIPKSGRVYERAQQWVGGALFPGAFALDATAGNGHDTLFLARRVGEEGKVWAVDLQESAIDLTRKRLSGEGLEGRVHLICGNHLQMEELLFSAGCQTLHAAIFNLGYLPGGNKALCTTPAGTLHALRATAARLLPQGRVAVVIYTGHPGGVEELRTVEEWAAGLDKRTWNVLLDPAPATRHPAPRCLFVQKN